MNQNVNEFMSLTHPRFCISHVSAMFKIAMLRIVCVCDPLAETSIDTGADLSEIDARLQALQDYMRELDTGH